MGAKILGICGSLQATSANLSLLQQAAASAPPDVTFILSDELRQLPLFNPDLEADGPPASVARWRRALAESDALFIASPEYGFSLPGSLKNGIDWVIGSGELEEKVVAVTAAVPSAERGRRGLQALCGTLSAVRAVMVGGEPIPNGPELPRRVSELFGDLLEALARAERAKRTWAPEAPVSLDYPF